jgi:hypothetical protein
MAGMEIPPAMTPEDIEMQQILGGAPGEEGGELGFFERRRLENLLRPQGASYSPQFIADWDPKYASGGMAGQGGPEVAVLGEEGPELVLNAKQTEQLAQSVKGYAGGGVAGLPQASSLSLGGTPASTSQGAPTASRAGAPMPPEEMMDEDEITAYLSEMTERFANWIG